MSLRILRASSIAISGTGGELRLTTLAAIGTGDHAEDHQDQRHREEAPEVGEVVARQDVIEQPGEADQDEQQRDREEDARHDAHERALRELRRLLVDLRLRELDLLADEDARVF